MRILVLVGSTREGRKSIRVARWISKRLEAREGVTADLVDLRELDLPIMRERLAYDDDAPPAARQFSESVRSADALLIVTPEYNHGYPGVVKNAIDYLYAEYRRKPTGIVTVSAGPFGGIRALEALRAVLFATGAILVPAELPITKVQESFDEEGEPTSEAWDKRLERFLEEFFWLAEAVGAKVRMEEERS